MYSECCRLVSVTVATYKNLLWLKALTVCLEGTVSSTKTKLLICDDS